MIPFPNTYANRYPCSLGTFVRRCGMGRPRKNTMSWVESWSQWTAYVDGKRHRLGTDQEEAVRQFKFLCRQAGDGGEADPNITIGEVSLAFMTAAAEQHTTERLPIIKQQL